MKYVISLLFTLCLLTGCLNDETPVSNTEPTVFSIPFEVTENLKEAGFSVLDALLCKYDAGTVFFEEETIYPDDFPDIFFAEYSPARLEAGNRDNAGVAAVMHVDLRHYDFSPAGRARFYFYNGEIIRSGYAPPGDEDAFVSLREKNLFEIKNPYPVEENRALGYPAPVIVPGAAVPGGLTAGHIKSGEDVIAAVKDETLYVYEYVPATGVLTVKNVFAHGGLFPVDFTFLPGGGFVVIMGAKDTDAGENDGYVKKIAEYISKKIVVLDRSLNIEFMDDIGEGYTAAAYFFGSVVLCRGNTLEFYDYAGGGLNKLSQAILPHWVESAESGVIAGEEEDLLVSDGRDLYLYRIENGIPGLVWRTRYGLAAVSRVIIRDLNGDGVSEIYATDGARSCLRYYLSDFGFKAETAYDAAGLYIFGPFGDNGEGWALIKDADGP